MNPYILKYPVRLLVVEDDTNNRNDCVGWLRDCFPNAHIDEAGSVESARQLIMQAFRQSLPYDCAILDLKVPEIDGGLESPNTSVAQLILDNFGRLATWLIQWTGYPEDQAIRAFQDANRIPHSGIVFEVISKRDRYWPEKMERFIMRLIAEKAVGHWFDEPHFINMRRGLSAVVSARPGMGGPPVSLPGFIHAVIEVWPFLDSHRRKEALETFRGTDWEIVEDGETIHLRNCRKAQAITDAKDNARIFEEVMARQSSPKRSK